MTNSKGLELIPVIMTTALNEVGKRFALAKDNPLNYFSDDKFKAGVNQVISQILQSFGNPESREMDFEFFKELASESKLAVPLDSVLVGELYWHSFYNQAFISGSLHIINHIDATIATSIGLFSKLSNAVVSSYKDTMRDNAAQVVSMIFNEVVNLAEGAGDSKESNNSRYVEAQKKMLGVVFYFGDRQEKIGASKEFFKDISKYYGIYRACQNNTEGVYDKYCVQASTALTARLSVLLYDLYENEVAPKFAQEQIQVVKSKEVVDIVDSILDSILNDDEEAGKSNQVFEAEAPIEDEMVIEDSGRENSAEHGIVDALVNVDVTEQLQ